MIRIYVVLAKPWKCSCLWVLLEFFKGSVKMSWFRFLNNKFLPLEKGMLLVCKLAKVCSFAIFFKEPSYKTLFFSRFSRAFFYGALMCIKWHTPGQPPPHAIASAIRGLFFSNFCLSVLPSVILNDPFGNGILSRNKLLNALLTHRLLLSSHQL